MAEYSKEKRYWIQLKRDFFKRHDMMILEAQPNGKEYALFYLKLMLESIDHNGELRFSETIPYNEMMLSTITNTNVDIVRSACKILHELGMIEVLNDGTLFIQETQKLLDYQSVGAERRQLQRQEKKESEDKRVTKGGQMSPTITNTYTNTNIDTITITDTQERIERNVFEDEFSNIPTLEEVINFINLKSFDVNGEQFWNYYQALGWKKGNTPIHDWQSLLCNWAINNDKDVRKKSNELKEKEIELREQEFLQRQERMEREKKKESQSKNPFTRLKEQELQRMKEEELQRIKEEELKNGQN